jgi:hypothetical protein
MVINFTSLQLIRFIYHDCSPTESQMLEECITSDGDLRHELNTLTESSRSIPKALFSAHPESIQKVLDYSLKLKA